MDKINILIEWIKESNNIVFFGGAGVSTESGLKDFRSVDGLYNEKLKINFTPEQLVSHSFFRDYTDEFYKFYKDKLNTNGLKPNITHEVLEKLESIGKLKAIVTQNIDGFHQDAGSKNVLELHGSIKRNYCIDCHKFYDDDYIFNSKGIPTCDCGGIVKPDVVLYEEGLNDNIINGAINAIRNADTLIIGGTSLAVYPAAGFINYFRGKNLVLINKTESNVEYKAQLVIHDSIGKVFAQVMKQL